MNLKRKSTHITKGGGTLDAQQSVPTRPKGISTANLATAPVLHAKPSANVDHTSRLKAVVESRLLPCGGKTVCFVRGLSKDVPKVLARGTLFGPTNRRMPGSAIQCHSNSAACWDANRGKCSIATGYALSPDGIWREHTWVVVPKNSNSDPAIGTGWKTIETTESSDLYYGYVMTDDEAELFSWENP